MVSKKNKETTKFESSEISVLSSEKFEKNQNLKYTHTHMCVYLHIILCVDNSIILSVNKYCTDV